jgi:hypothetical protein
MLCIAGRNLHVRRSRWEELGMNRNSSTSPCRLRKPFRILLREGTATFTGTVLIGAKGRRTGACLAHPLVSAASRTICESGRLRIVDWPQRALQSARLSMAWRKEKGMLSLSTHRFARGQFGRVTVALIAALLLPAPVSTAFAADVRQGDTIVVGANETINDDLYAFGSTVTILGTVNGDVFTAGGNITMSGTVNGDLFAAGGTTTVSGQVRQSVRAAGGTVMLNGSIGEDALAAGGTTGVGASASIGRDLLAATGTASISGPVTRNVLVSGGDVSLAGPVGGYVKAEAETLRLANGAQVAGGLTYTSPRQAEIASGATVGGATQRFEPQVRQQPAGPFSGPAAAVIDWIRGLVGLSVLGLAIVFLFPRFSQRELDVSRRSPWASLGLGFALLVGVPIFAVAVLIIGAILGGWWLALFVLAAYAAALGVGYIMSALFIGRSAIAVLRISEQHSAWYVVEGLALLGLVSLVPFVGGLIGLLAVVFGLGALTLAVVEAYRAQPLVWRRAQPTQAAPANGALVAAPTTAG